MFAWLLVLYICDGGDGFCDGFGVGGLKRLVMLMRMSICSWFEFNVAKHLSYFGSLFM